MRANVRPFYIPVAIGGIFLAAALWVYSSGESGVEWTFDYSTGESSTQQYSTYAWGTIITLLLIGIALLLVGAWLQKTRVDWPPAIRRALAGVNLQPQRGPGMTALRSRLLIAGPVPAQQLHQRLLDGFMAAPEPRQDAAVYLLESVPGRVRVAFGIAEAAPLWQVEAAVSQIGPDRSTAMVTVTDSRHEGQGLVAGEVLDAMFDHLARSVPRAAPGMTVTRGTADAV